MEKYTNIKINSLRVKRITAMIMFGIAATMLVVTYRAVATKAQGITSCASSGCYQQQWVAKELFGAPASSSYGLSGVSTMYGAINPDTYGTFGASAPTGGRFYIYNPNNLKVADPGSGSVLGIDTSIANPAVVTIWNVYGQIY